MLSQSSINISSYIDSSNSHIKYLDNLYNEMPTMSNENEQTTSKVIEINQGLFVCLKCNHSPKIVFKTRETLDLFCKCSQIENFDINNISNYIITYKNDTIKLELIVCKTHKIKYSYYCTQCKYDICATCLEKRISHKNHQLFGFLDENEYYKNIKNYIDKNYYGSGNEDFYFYKLLKSLLYTYKNFPSFNLFESIKSTSQFLYSASNTTITNPTPRKKENVEIVIRLPRELIENKNNTRKIREIKIEEKNLYNLNILCGLDLYNLKIMELQENNISDISPLLNDNLNFPNLEVLNLSKNHIGDKNITYFSQFHKKFTGLKKLDVSLNSLHNIQFFNAIIFLEKLEFLDAGSNRFYKKDDNNSKNESNLFISNNTNINFETLKELFLTRGSFSDKIVLDLFSHYSFKNLKILVLTGNDLNNLKFLKYFRKCEGLEEINLKNNRIKILDNEVKFENVKVIYLEYNLIDDTNNLIEFMKKFPNLKKIGISNNKFDLTNENKNYIKKYKNELEII